MKALILVSIIFFTILINFGVISKKPFSAVQCYGKYADFFNKSLINPEECRTLSLECRKWVDGQICAPDCLPALEEVNGTKLANPCRRFVEPCFGISTSAYATMRRFKKNDPYTF